MNLALDLARENRAVMLRKTKEIVFRIIRGSWFQGHCGEDEVNAHHNYAAQKHFGEMVCYRKAQLRLPW